METPLILAFFYCRLLALQMDKLINVCGNVSAHFAGERSFDKRWPIKCAALKHTAITYVNKTEPHHCITY